jgi:hypothetical protein
MRLALLLRPQLAKRFPVSFCRVGRFDNFRRKKKLNNQTAKTNCGCSRRTVRKASRMSDVTIGVSVNGDEKEVYTLSTNNLFVQ